jgi:hypothetical protein
MTKPIKVFVHLNDLPGAFDLMSEQLSRLSESGLMDIADRVFLCTNGNPDNFLPAQAVLSDYRHVKFYHTSNRTDLWEYPTLDLLKRNCQAVGEDEEFNILYFHLKGLSRLGDQRVTDWRKFMEYWMIDRWEDCANKLNEGYDLIGTNMIEQPWLHSSGNFWWSKSEYVRTLDPLPSPETLPWNTPSPYTGAVYDGGNFRYDHEAWIATGKPKWFEIASSPGKHTPGWHFENNYPESEYVQTSTV